MTDKPELDALEARLRYHAKSIWMENRTEAMLLEAADAIKALRAELQEGKAQFECIDLDNHTLRLSLEAARWEMEVERMRLAACGVAAMADTPETVAKRIERDSSYWSASYEDVCRQVNALMAVRAQLSAANAKLAGVGKDTERLEYLCRHMPGRASRILLGELSDTWDMVAWRARLDAALAVLVEGGTKL